MNAPAGYEDLADVLTRALEQAALGKGHERHDNGLPWADQPIFIVARAQGHGFLLGQAQKKVIEAGAMCRRSEKACAVRELLGAINYLAAAVQFLGVDLASSDPDWVNMLKTWASTPPKGEAPR